MLGLAKRTVRGIARRVLVGARGVLMRLLRPIIMRIDMHLQWLFDRQQDDRTRLVHLEQQVCALQRQLTALQREVSRQRTHAA